MPLYIDLVKIGQKVTIAKGLNLRDQNFHFFFRGQNRNIDKLRRPKL